MFLFQRYVGGPVGELLDILSDSQQKILFMIKRTSSLTVSEATEKLELAETTIRQHISHLEDKGLVERSKRVEGRGRRADYDV
jgi:predicted ArsR family transcriptional regulator